VRKKLEICVTDFASARNAALGGADRVELCADLASGGVTPSLGLVQKVVASAGINTHVLIRPRGGDFVYNHDEIEIMSNDIMLLKTQGILGIVIGALLPNNEIDLETTAKLCAAARPLSVTFHKAIDLTPDLVAAIKTLKILKIDRVLTSGGPAAARSHFDTLASMTKAAAGQIKIMAGGSVTIEDCQGLIKTCGCDEIHMGSYVCEPTPAPTLFGTRPAIVNEAIVRKVVNRLEQLSE
jgi:copper homeostasis protein